MVQGPGDDKMGFLTLAVAIAISGVAAWYSIIGLMAIFSAAAIPIAIMGGVLEVGKLVTASWLYQYWKEIPKTLKTYLTTAVIVLMFITSMGIFGFLSKAHIDQTIQTGDNSLQIEQLDKQIEREDRIIVDAEKVIGQLDQQVQTLINYDRIRGPSGSIATRKSQQGERDSLNQTIQSATARIAKVQLQRSVLEKEQLKLEAEVGPIRYVAELFYGEKADRAMLESAVRWVIIVIIFVFDPLAVLLLIAANMTLRKQHEKKKRSKARAKKRSSPKQQKVIQLSEENAVMVKEDPYIANNQVWEETTIKVQQEDNEPEQEIEGTAADMPAIGEEKSGSGEEKNNTQHGRSWKLDDEAGVSKVRIPT